jgi:hypothetical protein
MDHGPMIDRLTSLRIDEKEKTKKLNIKTPDDEEIQGLEYRRGQKVIDKTTGKEVTVLAGKRAVGKVPGP